MATLESIFIKEFKRNIRANGAVKNIYDVPLPEEAKNWFISGSDMFFINGLSSETSGLFYELNCTLVKRLPKNMVASKRKIDLVKRDFVRDKDNRFVYEDVKIPSDSIVIISKKNLNLPFGYSSDESGFGYIDFVTDGLSREFLYYVPKKYVYRANQTALALSVKSMKNYFGMGYVSWKYGVIFLNIIPYKPNMQYVGTKILKTSVSLDYSREVKKLVDYWISAGVIPNISLCDTDLEGNLVMKETIKGYDDYVPFDELSIGDREVYGSVESQGMNSEESK